MVVLTVVVLSLSEVIPDVVVAADAGLVAVVVLAVLVVVVFVVVSVVVLVTVTL